MTFAVRPMSNPVQMRDIAPQWMVEAPDRDAVTASIETLCEQFGGSSAVLFRINIDQAAPKTKLIASTGIEDQFRDAFIDRAAGSVAGGGYTGPGGRLEPAGVVHRGEVVWSQLDVARAGGVAVVEAMRRGMRGYDMGGIVAPRATPAIPSLAPALQEQLDGGGREFLGDMNFILPGGESITVAIPASQQPNMRRLRLKFGNT